MGIVYKLFCLDSDIKEFYIGSSTNFKKRKRDHKHNCNNENSNGHNLKVYKFIRANGGYNNFDYEILLETIEDDIKKIEQKYIDDLQPTLNCCNACGIDKIKKKEQMKKYYEKNKEYKLKNKEKIKEQSRLYRLKNKIKIREKQRLYYLKKKNNLNV